MSSALGSGSSGEDEEKEKNEKVVLVMEKEENVMFWTQMNILFLLT